MGRICKGSLKPEYVNINGTTFVTCVDDASYNHELALGLGLGLGIPIFIMIIYFMLYTVKMIREHKRLQKTVTHDMQAKDMQAKDMTVINMRRWETFIHEGSYIRRIAQLLEAEEKIPIEIQEYFKEFHKDVWESVHQKGCDDLLQVAILIKTLFEEQAKLESMSVLECIQKWDEKLVDKIGGEFCYKILDLVKKQCDVIMDE